MLHFFKDDETIANGFTTAIAPVLLQVLKDYNKTAEYVNIILMSDEEVLEINNNYLQHDYYTDIITFNYAEGADLPLEAELYISIDRVRENAAAAHVSYEDELARVCIHGVLHLCGHEDDTDAKKNVMQSFEDKYLRLFQA